MEKQQIDYGQLKKERVIRISDLLREIFQKIWLVIIMAVVFAALMAGYKYVRDSKSISDSADDVLLELPEEELTEEEAVEVNRVFFLIDDALQQQEYMDQSVLMQINAYNESRVVIQYRLSDIEDDSQALQNEYANYVENGALAADLFERDATLDIQYLSELISLTTTENIGNAEVELSTEQSASTFEVQVIQVDEESCRALAKEIETCINSFYAQLVSGGEIHSLDLVSFSYSRVVDQNLWNYKLNRINNLASTENKIDALKQAMTDDQLEVVEQYTGSQMAEELEEVEELEELEETQEVTLSKKYLAVGALVGMLLACMGIVILYLIRDTVNRAEEFQDMYDLRILGEVKTAQNKNLLIRALDHLNGKSKHTIDLNDLLEWIATYIELFCHKNGVEKLLLIAGDEVQENEDWMSDLIGRLAEAGIHVEVAKNILHSVQDMKKVAEYEHVALLKKLRYSRHAEIMDEIIFCAEQNVELDGVIVLN